MHLRRSWRALAPGLIGLLVACSNGDSKNPPSNPGGGGETSPGTVSGRAVDTQGRPLPNAIVWIKPGVTTGLSQTTTDAEGRYRVTGLPSVPFQAYAWTRVDYRGKQYCLRLGMPKASDYSVFNPEDGVVRDFRWQLTGKIEDTTFGADEDGAYFGGTVLIRASFVDGDYNGTVELKLTPTGPLIDGSTGQALTRSVDLNRTTFALDIPAGPYQARAEWIKPDGARSPLKLGPDPDRTADEMAIEFDSAGSSCGGNYASGLSRTFVTVTRP